MRGLLEQLFPGKPKRASLRRPRRACRLDVAPLEDRTLAFVGTITAVATPSILFPPNGRYVQVNVSGTIIESLKQAPEAVFQVTDEYRRVEPRGHLTLHQVNSYTYSYSFSVYLQAERSTRVPDGRHYDILVAAVDADAGNGKTIAVVVPRDVQQYRFLLKPRPPLNPPFKRH
jgi:hypothetical protein